MQRAAMTLAIMGLVAAAWMAPAPCRAIDQTPPHRSARVVADGYCVASLRDQRQWRRGDRRVGGTFDGRTYYFADLRQRDVFAAAPESYAPVLGGDCVVAWANSGQRTSGDVRHGIVRDGRLYFFASQQAQDEFRAEPARFVDADLADGGRCPVSRRDESRLVPGLPKTVAVRDGRRFLFASAHHRRLFLANPKMYDGDTEGKESADLAGIDASPVFAPTPIEGQGRRTAADVGGPLPGMARDAAGDADADLAAQDVLLSTVPAMGGYCPISIRQEGVWVRGRYDHRVEFDDLVFLTAGSEERDALAADPVRFIPALGGDCPVSLVDSSQRVRGSVFHALEYQDRLFLFASAEHKAAFKADPSKYSLADVAASGACVVAKEDDGREAPGLPEHAIWYRGWLYRFAGPEQKKQFHSRPERYARP